MKLLVSALALGFVLTASAPEAEARVCADGTHRTHCSLRKRVAHVHHGRRFRHCWHCRIYGSEGSVIVAAPPPYGYYPNGYYPNGYYPAFWGPLVDNPSAPFRNPLQWQMDQEGDKPFTSYPYYPRRPY